MYTKWTQHLESEDEKEKFHNSLISSKVVLDRLIQLIDEEVQALGKSELDQKNYTVANWPYLQAHRNGNKQTYAVIRKLIDLDQQRKEKD